MIGGGSVVWMPLVLLTVIWFEPCVYPAVQPVTPTGFPKADPLGDKAQIMAEWSTQPENPDDPPTRNVLLAPEPRKTTWPADGKLIVPVRLNVPGPSRTYLFCPAQEASAAVIVAALEPAAIVEPH
jgi:hypothetical protein